uniref:Uncharacterized protein n=1 Tax=Acrobeloides nanus TaxID=290746 RepID=A0A914CNM4_9BILA
MYAFAIPIIVIYSCDAWKRIFLRVLRRSYAYLRCKGTKVGNLMSDQEKYEKLKTSSGEKMVFVIEQEGGIYFQNLNKLWN